MIDRSTSGHEQFEAWRAMATAIRPAGIRYKVSLPVSGTHYLTSREAAQTAMELWLSTHSVPSEASITACVSLGGTESFSEFETDRYLPDLPSSGRVHHIDRVAQTIDGETPAYLVKVFYGGGRADDRYYTDDLGTAAAEAMRKMHDGTTHSVIITSLRGALTGGWGWNHSEGNDVFTAYHPSPHEITVIDRRGIPSNEKPRVVTTNLNTGSEPHVA